MARRQWGEVHVAVPLGAGTRAEAGIIGQPSGLANDDPSPGCAPTPGVRGEGQHRANTRAAALQRNPRSGRPPRPERRPSSTSWRPRVLLPRLPMGGPRHRQPETGLKSVRPADRPCDPSMPPCTPGSDAGCGTCSPLVRDDHDWACRVLDDLAAHRANQQPGETAAAACADDYQVGICEASTSSLTTKERRVHQRRRLTSQ